MATGGNIISANVAGGSAGGVVIGQPVIPSYAAYPDVLPETDLKSVFARNLDRFLYGLTNRELGKDAPAVTAQAPTFQVGGIALIVGGLALLYFVTR